MKPVSESGGDELKYNPITWNYNPFSYNKISVYRTRGG